MKIQLYGKNSEDIKKVATDLGFELVSNNPEVIISYGGDGTLLASENKYPKTPKLPIRDSKVCRKCSDHQTEHLLKMLLNNQIHLTTQPKLETIFIPKKSSSQQGKLIALNDIVIRNKSAYHAIRFFVSKNGKHVTDYLLIGDGIVASTPFGSTGYYQSITKSTFEKNFRIVFNNTVTHIPPLEFNNQDIITIDIVRGPGEMTSDNNPETIELLEGDQAEIKVSDEIANIFSPETLRCTKCHINREQRLHD